MNLIVLKKPPTSPLSSIFMDINARKTRRRGLFFIFWRIIFYLLKEDAI